jgi:hypothetical protein
MRASLMTRAFVALGALVVTLGLTQAQPVQLVIWDFNDGDTTADGGVNASLSSLALVGGTNATFAGGSPLDTATTNRGYNTTNYPTQGQNNLTAGIVFNTPTTGYMNVTVQFDVRWSNTASKYLRFQYTYDGVSWIDGPQLVAPGGDTWWSSQNITNPNGNTRYYVSFFGDTNADNNPNFAFRILAEFAPAITTIMVRETATRLGIVPLALCATTSWRCAARWFQSLRVCWRWARVWRVWSGCAAAPRSKPLPPLPLSHPVGEGSGLRATRPGAGEEAILWDEGSGVHGQARPWELPADDPSTNALSDSDRQALQEEIARRIVEEHQKSRGMMPAGWLRWAEAILKPKVNWREQLKRIVRGVISEGLGHRLDYSYRRPHRRSAVYHPLYLPALQGEYKPRVACVVDTSGSISDRELMQSLAEVRAVLEALRIPVTIIPCDAVPYEAIRVFDGSDWLKVRQGLRGGGGTDMVAGLNAALELKPKPEAVIVLTDGHTPFPSVRPKDTAVIWAIWRYGDREPPKPPMPPWRARDVVVVPI